MVRHIAHRLALQGLIDRVRVMKGLQTAHYNASAPAAARFAHIYDNDVWGSDGTETPPSGPGSALARTANVRAQLPSVLRDLGSSTLVDLGCGDLTWMSTIELPVRYVGVDVVADVIAENERRHSSPSRQFMCADALHGDLPDGDTVLCREILFHLSFADVGTLMRNLARKPRRWFIATTDTATWFNADIRSGDFRILNLRRSPFRWPQPDRTIDDSGLVEGRTLAIWRFDRLPLGRL